MTKQFLVEFEPGETIYDFPSEKFGREIKTVNNEDFARQLVADLEAGKSREYPNTFKVRVVEDTKLDKVIDLLETILANQIRKDGSGLLPDYRVKELDNDAKTMARH